MQSFDLHLTQTNTETNINNSNRQVVLLSNENNAILKTMLIFSLVLLDKLHRRTNLSLLLIHLRTLLDIAIDKNEANLDNNIDSIVLEFQDTMSIIFKNDKFFGITDFSKIFNKLNSSVLTSDKRSSKDLDVYVNQMLCISESMSDYVHFNGVFNELEILNYESEKLRNHYLSTSFRQNIIKQKDGDNVSSSLINTTNLDKVQSENFLNFHFQRWKLLGLLDTHIFKSNKK